MTHEPLLCKYDPSACPKKKYRNRAQAEKKLAEIQARGDVFRGERRAYRCPGCNRWHLTHYEVFIEEGRL
jgi:hypothetical protein